ncbi:MAG TPA: alternative ribosome rescue aminoacyl-tRNA hydrolase ArfB [Rhizomicrobium sp.]|jgi:ribosome-associated protein|nr:alternative ribosome rescue aminoacyl-tRNA hydrolase ArfB [Rhizomicrobium sp.]
MGGLFIKRGLVIPEAELGESFIRASGPGGQNVNKVASAVKLSFDVGRSPSLPEPVKTRLLALSDSRLDTSGVITITAQRFREQARNRADARVRLAELVLAATIAPKPRRATKPPRASKARRTDAKKRHGRIKKDRARPAWD